MRTFSVEEGMLLVGAGTLRPVSLGEAIVNRHEEAFPGAVARTGRNGSRFWLQPAGSGHRLTAELQQGQLEIVGPPRTTLAEQLEAIRFGRALADEAAAPFDARVVASGSPVSPRMPRVVDDVRHRSIHQRFGLVATEQLTCGLHVHVRIESREEGVAILDRIRVWLPVLLAMSANSPFWYGRDSGFSSFRYQAWSRWPTAGPTDVFGSVEEYDHHVRFLLQAGAALDEGMVYFDARLSSRLPTVEVRIADVCLDARHAAVVATLVRALVETSARQWQTGSPPLVARSAELRVSSWQAARYGLEGGLISPVSQEKRAAGDVVAAMLDLVRPVLAEYDEEQEVETVVYQMLREGTGSAFQRAAYRKREDLRDVVDVALQLTHPPEVPSSPPSLRK